MDFLLALAPPLAAWRYGTPSQRACSIALTLVCYVPGVLYSAWLVHEHRLADHRRHQPRLGRPNPFGSS